MLKKRKICIITPVHWTHIMGGIEYQVKLLVENLAQHNDVEITYLSRTFDHQYQPGRHNLVSVGNGSFIQRYGYFLDTFHLMRLLNRLKPDVIYENGGCAYTGIAAYYAQKTGCKMIWHIASDNDLNSQFACSDLKPNKWIEKKFFQWGIKNAAIIVAQSEFQKIIVNQRNQKAIIHLIRNFHPTPISEEMPEKSNQIVWVANIKPLKQPELFIQLADSLARRNIDVQCLMVGAPTNYPKGYQASIEDQIRGVYNLKYLGKLPQEEVNQIIARSMLFINTSKWEGFPNTFIQSWMRKTPVISLHCDPDNVIRDYQCGVVSGTMEKMISDVLGLLDNNGQRNALGEKARHYARCNHSLENLNKLKNIILET